MNNLGGGGEREISDLRKCRVMSEVPGTEPLRKLEIVFVWGFIIDM